MVFAELYPVKKVQKPSILSVKYRIALLLPRLTMIEQKKTQSERHTHIRLKLIAYIQMGLIALDLGHEGGLLIVGRSLLLILVADPSCLGILWACLRLAMGVS